MSAQQPERHYGSQKRENRFTCGSLGCRSSGSLKVEHPERGEIVVCQEHSVEFDVVGIPGGDAGD